MSPPVLPPILRLKFLPTPDVKVVGLFEQPEGAHKSNVALRRAPATAARPGPRSSAAISGDIGIGSTIVGSHPEVCCGDGREVLASCIRL